MSYLRLRRRPISKTTEKVPTPDRWKMRSDLKKSWKNEVRSPKNEVGDVRSQKVGKPQKKMETLVRLLWRAAGSGAKATQLAARPITIYPPAEVLPLINTLYATTVKPSPRKTARTKVQSTPSAAARGGEAWRRNVWSPVYIRLSLQLSLTLACIMALSKTLPNIHGASHVPAPRLTSTSTCRRLLLNFSTVPQGRFFS